MQKNEENSLNSYEILEGLLGELYPAIRNTEEHNLLGDLKEVNQWYEIDPNLSELEIYKLKLKICFLQIYNAVDFEMNVMKTMDWSNLYKLVLYNNNNAVTDLYNGQEHLKTMDLIEE